MHMLIVLTTELVHASQKNTVPFSLLCASRYLTYKLVLLIKTADLIARPMFGLIALHTSFNIDCSSYQL